MGPSSGRARRARTAADVRPDPGSSAPCRPTRSTARVRRPLVPPDGSRRRAPFAAPIECPTSATGTPGNRAVQFVQGPVGVGHRAAVRRRSTRAPDSAAARPQVPRSGRRAVATVRYRRAVGRGPAGRRADKALQVYVSQLRRALGAATRSSPAPPATPSSSRPARSTSSASRRSPRRRARRPREAAELLREALALFRGAAAGRRAALRAGGDRGRAARRAAARPRSRTASSSTSRSAAHARAGRRARGADRRAPVPRAPARPADARALPRGPPGRRAGGLPARARALVEELGLEPEPRAAAPGGGDPRPGPRRSTARPAAAAPAAAAAPPLPVPPTPLLGRDADLETAARAARRPRRAAAHAHRARRDRQDALRARARAPARRRLRRRRPLPRAGRRDAERAGTSPRRSAGGRRAPPRGTARCCWWSTTSSSCSTPRRELAGLLAAVPALSSWSPAARRCGWRASTSWRSPPLAEEPAVALFRRRARAVDPRLSSRRTSRDRARSASASTACRWRSSSPPRASRCSPRRDPGPPEPAAGPAQRRPARRARAPADAAGGDRLELRPARPRRPAPVHALGVFSGGFTLSRGGGGLRRRGARRHRRARRPQPR